MADYDSQFNTAIVKDNEVVKAEDINYGFDSLVSNVSRAMQMIFDAERDFVIGGAVSVYNKDLNIVVAPIYGVCKSTGEGFGSTETSDPIAVTPGTSDRVDIVEVQASETEYDEQQRAFSDLDTGTKTYQNVYTKKATKVSIVVKRGEDGSVSAPEVDEGYVKIAEIHVSANAERLRASDIYNITADVAEMENDEWTTEKDATYNIGYISDVNARFRTQHNVDGSHQAGIIGINELNAGTGSDQVNAGNLGTTNALTLDETELVAGTSIQTVFTNVCSAISNLFASYLKYGAFNFNGEIALSNLVEENALTKAIKIGANGDGTAYCKIGDKSIFTIQSDGRITMADGYVASSTTDLVTKSVTDSISTTVSGIDTRLKNVEENLDPTAASNRVLSKFTTSIDVMCVATSNISLSGNQSIDGYTTNAGDIVLIIGQTDAKENGVYEASSSDWSRYYATSADITKKFYNILKGSDNAGKMYYSVKDAFTVGTDDITFVEYYGSIKTKANRVVMRDSEGNANVNKLNGFTPASAMAKSVDTTMQLNSENLPTNQAITNSLFGYVDTEDRKSLTTNTLELSYTIPGVYVADGKVQTGTIIRLNFANLCRSSAKITTVSLSVNGSTAAYIVSPLASSTSPETGYTHLQAKQLSSNAGGNYDSTYCYLLWDIGVTLEMVFNGTYWVIIGNPSVIKYASDSFGYEVKADGLINQYILNCSGRGTTYNLSVVMSSTSALCVCSATGAATEWQNIIQAYLSSASQVYTYIGNYVAANVYITGY